MAIPLLSIHPGSNLTFPWTIFTSRGQTPTEMSFSKDGQRIAEILITDWSLDINKVIPEIVGYPRRVDVAKLTRNLPMRHPQYFWLYGRSVPKMQPYKALGKLQVGYGPTAYHLYNLLTVVYESLPFEVRTDAQVSTYTVPEFNRFTEKYYDAGAEYLSLERRGAFKFIPEAGGDLTSRTIHNDLPKLTTKADLTWIWHDIPHNGLFTTSGVPTNVEAGLGKVNSLAFPDANGFPAGTLLMLGAKITPTTAPVSPHVLGLADNVDPPRLWRVEYKVKYYNPPPGGTYRGHNTLPKFDGSANLKWYLATTDGTTTGATTYETYDFAKFFQVI